MGKPRLLIACAALIVTLVLPSRASAALITFTTELDGLQETPPTETTAFGYGQMLWDEVRQELRWTIYYQGLTTPATAAHFHFGAPGIAGPIALPIPGSTGLRTALLMGAAIVTPSFVEQLMAGDVYVNIHSETFPGGELRGQVVPLQSTVPEPSTMLLLGSGVLLFSRRIVRTWANGGR